MPRCSKDELNAFWDFADKNGDGQLTINEFKDAVRHFHAKGGQKGCAPPSQRQICDMFAGMNDNNDSTLSKQEYLNHMDREERTKDTLYEAFKQFDKDGDGSIDRNELRQLLQRCKGFKEEDVDKVLNDCDRDGDGKIDFDEFMKAL